MASSTGDAQATADKTGRFATDAPETDFSHRAGSDYHADALRPAQLPRLSRFATCEQFEETPLPDAGRTLVLHQVQKRPDDSATYPHRPRFCGTTQLAAAEAEIAGPSSARSSRSSSHTPATNDQGLGARGTGGQALRILMRGPRRTSLLGELIAHPVLSIHAETPAERQHYADRFVRLLRGTGGPSSSAQPGQRRGGVLANRWFPRRLACLAHRRAPSNRDQLPGPSGSPCSASRRRTTPRAAPKAPGTRSTIVRRWRIPAQRSR